MANFLQKYQILGQCLIILGWLLPYPVWAGDNLIPDSLNQKIAAAQSDTARLRAIFARCTWIRDNKNELAVQYYEEAISLAKNLNSQFWEAKFTTALGNHYSFQEQFTQSIALHYKALRMFESLPNEREIAGVCHNLAMCYARLRNTNEAFPYLRRAARINLKLNNKDWLCRNYGELAGVHKDLQQFDSALYYFQLADQLAEKMPPSRQIGTKSNIGNLYIKLKQFRLAEAALRKAYEIAQSKGSIYNKSHTAMLLADCYQSMHQPDKAEKYLLEAITLKQTHHIGADLDYCYDIYAELEEKRGNFDKALAHYRRYIRMKDSTDNLQTQKIIQEYEVQYQSEKKESENVALLQANQLKQQQLYGLTGLLLLIGLFGGYWYYAFRTKQKANQTIEGQKADLEAKNKLLEEMLQEKSNIMATIAHDYRSPLGRIRAIYDLLSLEKQQLSAAKQAHLDKIPAILSEATYLIDDLLEITQSQTDPLPLSELVLHKKLTDLFQRYQPWIEKKGLRFVKTLPPAAFSVHTNETALMRILENLLSNAIKFTDFGTTIHFSVIPSALHTDFLIQDEGAGFSEADRQKLFTPFQRLSAQPIGVGNSYGLGLSIVKKLAGQIGAEIECLEVEKGALMRLRIFSQPQ